MRQYIWLLKISWVKFIYYNFICKQVERTGKGYVFPYKGAVIELAKNSLLTIHNDNFHICFHKIGRSRAEAYVKLLENAQLEIKGKVVLNYNATIEVHKNAKIEMGMVDINSGAVIVSADNICIGNGVLISRDVIIYDSDHHDIIDDEDNKLNPSRPVIIGDNVWIGVKCIVLRGANIGEGAVISAGSLVGGKIKSKTMASGNPARSYSEVKWRK